jgi:uncharacterized membrane protein
MALLVALVLRGGVLLAALVTLAGGVGVLARDGGNRPDYRIFHGGEAPYRTLPEILTGAGRLEMPAVVALGIVLLIATPVARVILTWIGFVAERDRIYVLLTAVVALALLYSLTLGGTL